MKRLVTHVLSGSIPTISERRDRRESTEKQIRRAVDREARRSKCELCETVTVTDEKYELSVCRACDRTYLP